MLQMEPLKPVYPVGPVASGLADLESSTMQMNAMQQPVRYNAPLSGREGQAIHIRCHESWLPSLARNTLKVTFGFLQVKYDRITRPDGVYLLVSIPPVEHTQWLQPKVPIVVHFEDQGVSKTVAVGDFQYLDGATAMYGTPQRQYTYENWSRQDTLAALADTLRQQDPRANMTPTRSNPIYRSVPENLPGETVIFKSDPSLVVLNWTPMERQAGRRIVRFWFDEQDASLQYTIAPNEQPPSEKFARKKPLSVSCIYWPKQHQYYFTSVDCISLVEYVLMKTFTVDEKNRIRRNLEGFQPQTISKTREQTADFFRTIMAFPKPKPRKIEKDIKIFEWSVLPAAVNKIYSRYKRGARADMATPPSADLDRNSLKRVAEDSPQRLGKEMKMDDQFAQHYMNAMHQPGYSMMGHTIMDGGDNSAAAAYYGQMGYPASLPPNMQQPYHYGLLGGSPSIMQQRGMQLLQQTRPLPLPAPNYNYRSPVRAPMTPSTLGSQIMNNATTSSSTAAQQQQQQQQQQQPTNGATQPQESTNNYPNSAATFNANPPSSQSSSLQPNAQGLESADSGWLPSVASLFMMADRNRQDANSSTASNSSAPRS